MFLLVAMVGLPTLSGCEEIRRMMNTPEIAFMSPINGQSTEDSSVIVRGTIQDLHGIVALSFSLNGGGSVDVISGWNAMTSQFEFEVDDLTIGNNTILLAATNIKGYSGTEMLSIRRVGDGPQLVISSPAEGAEIDGDSVTVTGTLNSDSELSRARLSLNNGAEIDFISELNSDGSFSVEVDGLRVGENTITITARDKAQATATASRSFTRIGADVDDELAIQIVSPEDGFETEETTVEFVAQLSGHAEGVSVWAALGESAPIDLDDSINDDGTVILRLGELTPSSYELSFFAAQGDDEPISDSISFTILEPEDVVPDHPDVTFLNPSDGDTLITHSFRVRARIEATDEVQELSWSLNDDEPTELDPELDVSIRETNQVVEFPLTILTSGAHTLNLMITMDGYEPFTVSVQFFVDLPPPPECDTILANSDFEEPTGIVPGIIGWETEGYVNNSYYSGNDYFNDDFFDGYPEAGTRFIMAATGPGGDDDSGEDGDDDAQPLVRQSYSVNSLSTAIDSGSLLLEMGGLFGGIGNPSDYATLTVFFVFEDADGESTSASIEAVFEDGAARDPWLFRAEELIDIPEGTRELIFEITFTQEHGEDNPAYVDSVWANIRNAVLECASPTSGAPF